MKPTSKQINKLIYEMENSPKISIQKIWDMVPSNNKAYPDIKANYKRAIFADWLEAKATERQVSYLITLVMRGYMAGKVKLILRKINEQSIGKK